MITLSSYAGKQIAILGLGKTGRAAAQALHQSGATVYLWDDKQESGASLPVSLAQCVQHYDDWNWETLDAVLLSPGIPLTHPEPHEVVKQSQQHGVCITSDIELLYEACPQATYIAITGTNGKSTTTSLIGHILQGAGRSVQVGGNLGTPALAMQPLNKDEIYVLELSSFQLDLLQHTHFQMAIFLNLSPDHLDRHGDMDGYIAAKQKIFMHQTQQDVAIIGVDDAYTEAIAREKIAAAQQKMIPIMTTQQSDKGIWVKGGILHNPLSGNECVLDVNLIDTLRGEHNHQNAAAAYAACWSAGLSHNEIAAGMQTYPGLAHRMQQIAMIDGIRFVNDSKATNADAAAKSLSSYEHIFWIAGGVAKAGGIESLAPYFPRIKHAFLIGEAQDMFAQTLGEQVHYSKHVSLQEAVLSAFKKAQSSDLNDAVILLAPACASFDQFANFEVRGDVFADVVNQLAQDTEHLHAG